MIQAIACGLYGSAASVFGKLALSENFLIEYVAVMCSEMLLKDDHICKITKLTTRAILFGFMLVSNAAMIANFLQAMEKNASVIVTVVSTAVNYLVTGAVGLFLFKEPVGSYWIIGYMCICFGLCLISISQEGLPKLRARKT